jgi:hypothetical protein
MTIHGVGSTTFADAIHQVECVFRTFKMPISIDLLSVRQTQPKWYPYIGLGPCVETPTRCYSLARFLEPRKEIDTQWMDEHTLHLNGQKEHQTIVRDKVNQLESEQLASEPTPGLIIDFVSRINDTSV